MTGHVHYDDSIPSNEEIFQLWESHKTPESVRAHSKAVCEVAMQMADALGKRNIYLDRGLLRAAALLHDMCRKEKNHSKAAADCLRDLGYLRLAEIVELHHGGIFSKELDEAQILFLADKQIVETTFVSIEERFAQSLQKCSTEEARAAHAEQLRLALEIQTRYQANTV